MHTSHRHSQGRLNGPSLPNFWYISTFCSSRRGVLSSSSSRTRNLFLVAPRLEKLTFKIIVRFRSLCCAKNCQHLINPMSFSHLSHFRTCLCVDNRAHGHWHTSTRCRFHQVNKRQVDKGRPKPRHFRWLT